MLTLIYTPLLVNVINHWQRQSLCCRNIWFISDWSGRGFWWSYHLQVYVGILALHSVHPWNTATVSRWREAHISTKYTSATLLRPTLVPSSMWQGLARNRECCQESNQLRSATQGALRECELSQSRLTVQIFSGSSSCTISGIMSLAYASTKATHWTREWKEVRREGGGWGGERVRVSAGEGEWSSSLAWPDCHFVPILSPKTSFVEAELKLNGSLAMCN